MPVPALRREAAAPTTSVLLARAAHAIASRPSSWQPLVHFDPDERYYARIPQRLAIPGGFEAWLLTWLPGQRTGWHDHGGSAGAVVVVRGVLSENLVAGSEIHPVEQRELTRGHVRPFGAHHQHEMLNRSSEPAVSVHVYAPELTSMTRYRLDGASLIPTAVERAGLAW
jgi:predicted metal-dependent enzyme (double-stranded beta helix superfamily)